MLKPNRLLPEGWFWANEKESIRLHNELQKELPLGHMLYGLLIKVVAHRDGASDDILCQHVDEERFTVVHLTWSMKEEIDTRFPTVEVDGSYQDFVEYTARFN